jgi:hypothetical protein
MPSEVRPGLGRARGHRWVEFGGGGRLGAEQGGQGEEQGKRAHGWRGERKLGAGWTLASENAGWAQSAVPLATASSRNSVIGRS